MLGTVTVGGRGACQAVDAFKAEEEAHLVTGEPVAKGRVLIHGRCHCSFEGPAIQAGVKQQRLLKEDCWGSKAIQKGGLLLLLLLRVRVGCFYELLLP